MGVGMKFTGPSRLQLSVAEAATAILTSLANLPRPARRAIAITLDGSLCMFAIWLSLSLRLGTWHLMNDAVQAIAIVALPIWFICAWWCEIYSTIIRSTGPRAMADLAVACLLFAIPMIVIFLFIGAPSVPRTIGILHPIIFLTLLILSRLVIRYAVVEVLGTGSGSQHRVVIYGAGNAGQQLAQALKHERHMALVGYIDDDLKLVDQLIDGVRIYSADALGRLSGERLVDEILLALPSAGRARRAEIIENLRRFGVRVRSLPPIGHIIDGKASVSDLRDINVDELLGRDAVPPDEGLLGKIISGRVVLVTGAGGSIGSELCRQTLLRGPKRLVLVDNSEFALYRIDAELRNLAPDDCVIIPELGDIADEGTVRRLFQRHRPQTVLHAAAYKHVPLVEANPIAGLRNNIFGTLNCCLSSGAFGVERFVFVSTDKAVRPTNVMGASKRICELVLQARAAAGDGPVFSMVRFGNVLDSSGSVVPKFREQIARGGPITLTHPDVTRYFMTIPEAAQLVLQAGAMAHGGEVFVLDMGQPIKIIDLARTMIELSGLSVRNEDNPEGDIVIEEIGLRPGEKMYEELLLGENPEPTAHRSIMRATETMISWPALEAELRSLREIFEEGNVEQALAAMRRLVPEYQPRAASGGVDPISLWRGRQRERSSEPHLSYAAARPPRASGE
jgi:FlaA1/EpsC-like NDP-sugar epimerase